MTFYWHDYETWGISARHFRPSQFAGIRTDEDFNVVGEPTMLYNKPTDDFLPDPEAVLITGITPQMALQKGVSEAEFAARIHKEFTQAGTVSVGYNSIRFDEQFTRFLFYRNFYDPYEHTYANSCSRWDIVDLVRLTRALRPDGIEWPVIDGVPTNRLEHLSIANGIEHSDAHDALADVRATIGIAKRIKQAQPKLYDYVFSHRTKDKAKKLLDVDDMTPVVHASNKYESKFLSTSLVAPIGYDPRGNGDVVVFDLRQDPAILIDSTVDELKQLIFTPKAELPSGQERLRIKTVRIRNCPVIAPAGTLDEESATRIQVDIATAMKHQKLLQKASGLDKKIKEVFSSDSKVFSAKSQPADVDELLYEGFFDDHDKRLMDKIHSASAPELAGEQFSFNDTRATALLRRYRAHNYYDSLSAEEKEAWQVYRRQRLIESGPITFEDYANKLQKLASDPNLSEEKQYLLEELHLYAEAIAPEDLL